MSTGSHSAATTDPLLEQSTHNKLSEPAPATSGSQPPVPPEQGEKNVAEAKLEEAFGKVEHDREISGAGVGNHPPR